LTPFGRTAAISNTVVSELFQKRCEYFPTPAGDPPLPAEELVPEGSPDHHAPTQIQTLAHRPAAAGGHQINGTVNVTDPDTVVI
jgi:hypothetical protein